MAQKTSRLCLGIESSCDETAAAVVQDGRQILSNVVSTQTAIHQKYGGVVPEVASRQHVAAILPVIDAALADAGVSLDDLDLIAATYGPGLVGSLLVGLTAGKTLALATGLPFVGVNHVEGHIYANFLVHDQAAPPAVCLTVSGGHTALVHVVDYGVYRVLGRTQDDAAGEAFDKIARVLGLPYPGGPQIEKLARTGNPQAYALPRGLIDEPNYHFSFSGMKTAALNAMNSARQQGTPVSGPDFAASVQEAIVDALVTKTVRAVDETGVGCLLLSGGVAANRRLQERLGEAMEQRGVDFFFPPPALCVDNAAMIASAGYFRWRQGEMSSLDLNAVPGLRLN